MAYFVLGIPVETYEDELKTIDFGKGNKTCVCSVQCSVACAGHKLYDDAVRMGWYKEVEAKTLWTRTLTGRL